MFDGVLINGYYVKGNITLGGKKIKGIAGRSFANNQKIKKLKLSGIKNIAGSAFAEDIRHRSFFKWMQDSGHASF